MITVDDVSAPAKRADGRIVPSLIPGLDIDVSQLEASKTTLSTTATGIENGASDVITQWSALTGVYESPDAADLYLSMDPVGTDAHAFAEKLRTIATLLDSFITVAQSSRARLVTIKGDAEDFVSDVEGGVTVQPWDMDHPMWDWGGWSAAAAVVKDEVKPAVIPWHEHGPSVDRNKELFERINTEVAALLQAEADFVNGVHALSEQYCYVPVEAPTAEQLNNSDDLPYGESPDKTRSCAESFRDGGVRAVTEMASGIGTLVFGYNPETGLFNDDEYQRQALIAAGETLGAVVVSLVIVKSIATPDDQENPIVAEAAWDLQEWAKPKLEALLGGLVGTPEQWEDNPAEASGALTVNILSFLIPGGGIVKGGSALGKISLLVARLEKLEGVAGIAGKVGVNVGKSLDEFVSKARVVLTEGGSDASKLASLNDLANKLDVDLSGGKALDELEQIAKTTDGDPSKVTGRDVAANNPVDVVDINDVGRAADDQPTVGQTDGGPGSWQDENRGPHKPWMDEQSKATGVDIVPGDPDGPVHMLEYVVKNEDGVAKFDGHSFRNPPGEWVFEEVKGNHGFFEAILKKMDEKTIFSSNPEGLNKIQKNAIKFINDTVATAAKRDSIIDGNGVQQLVFTKNPELAGIVREALDRAGLDHVEVVTTRKK